MIDQVVGNFRVLSLLGQGGMGEVYLAEHQGIQTRVAIKMLMPEISRDQAHVQRFFNEARIVGRIKHAGIVKIFDVGFHLGRAYLVMELLEGESLAGRIQRGRIATAELVDIAHQIASILAASHAAGVVHRDLKPDNIYLCPDAELGSRARVKVLDFGIAKLSGVVGGPRTIGTMGTPAYMAPEQWGDSSSVDWRADIYSLGCVAFEMATGRPPFAATTIAEAFRNHTQMAPPAVRTLVPELSPELEQVLGCLLAKEPARRAESTDTVARSFELLRELPVEPEQEWTDPTGTHAVGGSRLPTSRGTTARGGSRAATSPGATRAATTLGASAGEVAPESRRRRRGIFAGAVVGLSLAVVATIAVARGGSGDGSPVAAAPPAQRVEKPATPAPPPPAPPVAKSQVAKPAPPPPPPVAKPEQVAKPAPAPVAKPQSAAKPTPVVKPAAKPAPTKPTPAKPAPAPRSELEDRT